MPNAITNGSTNVTFYNSQSDAVSKKLTDTVKKLNDVSKSKYDKKNHLIENATDLNTSEKLEAMDQNFTKYVHEEYSGIIIFAFLSISIMGITTMSPTVIKSFKKLIA